MSQAMPYLFCPRRWLSRHDVCALNHTCTLFVVRASSLGRISVATQSFDGCNSVRTLHMDTTAAVGTHVIIPRHFYRELAYSEINGVEYMCASHSLWPRIPAEFHCLDSGAKRWLLILRVSLRIPQRGANANGALEQGNSAPTPILMETDRQCRYNPVDVAQRQVLRQRRDREFLRLPQEEISCHVGYLRIYALAMALREYIHWYTVELYGATVELYGATVRNLWVDPRKPTSAGSRVTRPAPDS